MPTECPAADGSSPKKQKFSEAPPMCIDPSKNYTATMVTNKGTMTIALDPVAAPKKVNNFVFLARYHYYDGVTFHRIIPGFVIQGGDPQGTGMGGPGYKFADELPRAGRYEIGSLAMANAGPNTNGSQFFIVHKDYPLPPNYTIFGKLTDGLDTLDKIATTPTGPGRGGPDTPRTPVTINTITIEES